MKENGYSQRTTCIGTSHTKTMHTNLIASIFYGVQNEKGDASFKIERISIDSVEILLCPV